MAVSDVFAWVLISGVIAIGLLALVGLVLVFRSTRTLSTPNG